jgi:hypothetical protein
MLKHKVITASIGSIAAALTIAACGGGEPTAGADTSKTPNRGLPQGSEPVKLDPADFTIDIDNPYWPMRPGSKWVYSETEPGGPDQKVVVTVTDKVKTIANGIKARVIRDVASEKGKTIEATDDWYAQDKAGNVWYFGEDTSECKDGMVTSRHGAWEGGVDGAQPGVTMLADPRVGDLYRQEFYAGEAEDQARVIKLDGHVEGPAGTFDDVLVTEDFTPLEPDLLEEKSYARGVGVVQEQTVKGGSGVVRLLEVTHGDPPLAEPAAFDPCHE